MPVSPSQETATAAHEPPLRIAYLILAHQNPDQLLRLVQALPADSPVFIHFDQRADVSLYNRSVELLKDRPQLHFVERYTCRWGAIGIVEATLSAIRGLLTSKLHFDYAILLSGSDYPIKSNHEIGAFLERNRGTEFIESFHLARRNRWTDQGGYYTSPQRMLARHLRFRSRIIRLPGMRRLPANLEPYGGSQWWCLSAEAIRYIGDFAVRVPQLLKFCRNSFIPDEAYVQTVLSNSPLADRIVADDLRLVIWDRPTPPYPATLTVDDLDMLIASEKLFARKFNLRDHPALYDAIDRRNDSANQ